MRWDIDTGNRCASINVGAEPLPSICVVDGYVYLGCNGRLLRFWAWDVPWNRLSHSRFPSQFRAKVVATLVAFELGTGLGPSGWRDPAGAAFARPAALCAMGD